MSMLARFFSWWLGELSACIPATLRSASEPRVLLLAAQLDGDVLLDLRRRGRREFLGTLADIPRRRLDKLRRGRARGRLAVVLTALPEQVARRRLTLPEVSDSELRGVLRFELDRLTPFDASEVWFGHQIVSRQKGSVDIELVFLPRELLTPTLAALEQAGLAPSRIETMGREGKLEGVELTTDEMRGPVRRSRPVTAALLVIAGALAATLGYLELTDRLSYRDGLQAAVAEALEKARAETETVAAKGDTADRRAAYELKQSHPSTLVLLTALSDTLPDHTWLESLDYDGEVLTIAGVSGDAAALAGAIDDLALFTEPRFISPISRGEDERERFVLTFRLDPGEDIGK